MIPGIVAAQMLGAGGPTTGDVFIDFVDDIYTIGGTGYALADAIDHTGLVDSDGLEIPSNTADSQVEITTLFNQIPLSGVFTIVLEFSFSAIGGELIDLQNFDPNDTGGAATQIWTNTTTIDAYQWDAAGNDNLSDSFDSGLVIHRVGLTQTLTDLSMSVDGQTAVTVSTTRATDQGFIAAYFGGESSPSGYSGTSAAFTLRKAWFYISPKSDVELAVLAAPPVQILGPVGVYRMLEGTAFDGLDFSAGGGTAPYSYAIHSGSLPSGISIDGSTGAITGTASANGSFSSIVVRVTDDLGDTADSDPFTLVVVAAPAGDEWVLYDTWTYSSNVTAIDFTGLGGFTQVMIFARGLAHSFGPAQIRLSTDRGVTFDTSTTSATIIDDSGQESSNALELINGGGVSGFTIFDTWGEASRPNVSRNDQNASNGTSVRFWSSGAPNALRLVRQLGGNITGGHVDIYVRAG